VEVCINKYIYIYSMLAKCSPPISVGQAS